MRRLIALLCIALIVLTTVTGSVSGHFTEVLTPLWEVLFPVLAAVIVRRQVERGNEQLVSLLALLASRPPPALSVRG